MTANMDRGSAQIVAFPARGRFAQVERRDDAKATINYLPRAAKIVSSGAWYHDEAIQQAEQARNN